MWQYFVTTGWRLSVVNPLAVDLDGIIERAEPDLQQLKGEHLFITGGTGFFGLWLLETLAHANRELQLGVSATVLSRAQNPLSESAPHLHTNGAFSFVTGDIRDFSLPFGSFDRVIHGATTTARETYNHEDPLRKFDTVALGTKRMLEFAAQRRSEKVLYLGSGACYGAQPANLPQIDESYPGAPDPKSPNSALGIGKRTAEFYCQTYASQHDLDVTIARCFSFFGPYLPIDIHYAIGNFVADGLAGRPIQVNGDGTAVRTYLYVADLMVWLLALLVRGRKGEAYNVGSSEEMTIRELAESVAAYFGSQATIALEPSGAPANRYVPCVRKATTELGVAGWTSFNTGLDRMVQHIEARPDFYEA